MTLPLFLCVVFLLEVILFITGGVKRPTATSMNTILFLRNDHEGVKVRIVDPYHLSLDGPGYKQLRKKRSCRRARQDELQMRKISHPIYMTH